MDSGAAGADPYTGRRGAKAGSGIIRVLTGALLFTFSVHAEEFSGRVVGVAEGDTITVLVGIEPRRVRLAGIDAPEKGQPFGQRAKQALSRLAVERTVRVVVRGQDRYGRTLGEVLLPDGVSLNERLVGEGWAWHYTRYSKDQRLAELEAAARRSRRGLWVDPHPVPPWAFRIPNRR
jgi:micrococcal nuclease